MMHLWNIKRRLYTFSFFIDKYRKSCYIKNINKKNRGIKIKGFFSWIKNMSTKQTVILVGLAVTLYLHFSQGLAVAITQGQPGAMYLSITIWASVLISIAIMGLVMLLLIYIIKSIFGKIRKSRRDKKPKK